MADHSAIEWTDATWNPVVGCSIVSPGCTHCYAMAMAARIEAMAAGAGKLTHYAGTTRKVNGKPVWTGKLALAPEHILTQPLRWARPRRVFVNSMSDLFHEDVPDEVIDRVFAVMALCPQHTFQVLTKRSARMREYLSGAVVDGRILLKAHRFLPKGWRTSDDDRWGYVRLNEKDDTWHLRWPLPNVWLGVSAERQAEADQRIPDLLATPAAIRFVSAEPLLGPVDFYKTSAAMPLDGHPWKNGPILQGIDWRIVGGESGHGARPMHPDWARAIRNQCAAAGVPFFFKQWGAWLNAEEFLDRIEAGPSIILRDGERWTPRRPLSFADAAFLAELTNHPYEHQSDGSTFLRLRKHAAGRLLDSREHNGMPAPREVPAL